MAFQKDLAVFFNPADFAVTAVFTRGAATIATCNVIFDDPTQTVNLYEQALEESTPRLHARTADVAAVRRGDIATVNTVAYEVERLTEDGTGVSILYLARN